MKAYRNALYGIILVLVLLFSGCPNPTISAALDSIEVTPTTLSVAVGASSAAIAVSAVYADDSTQDVAAADVTWTTSAAGVATVADGIVTGVAAGTATITATYEEKTATVAVTVTAAAAEDAVVESIALAPTTLSFEVGESSAAIEVTATYDDASTAAVAATDVTWSTSAAGVATVSDGVVTGVAEGSATITATYEGKTADVAVTVVAAVNTGLITNGAFSSDLSTDWNLWSHDSATTASIVDGEAVLVVPSVGSAWWAVQFDQRDIPVPSDGAGAYTLSFDGRSSVARDMRIEVVPSMVAITPTNLDFALSTETQSYTATVNISGLGETPIFKLNIGLGNISSSSVPATVYIDNIALLPQEEVLPTSTLTVNVNDGTSAIEGATVTLNTGTSAVTDATGVATFNLESRQYPVSVTMSGYVGYSEVIQLTGDTTINATLTVAAPTEDAYLYGTTETVDVTSTIAHWDSGSAFDSAYDGDATYNPSIEVTTSGNLWGSGTSGFAVAFTGYTAGSAVGYDNLVFKIKTTEFTDVSVKFPSATTEEVGYSLAVVGTDLTDGWKLVTIPLSDFGDLGSNTEVGILRFQGGVTEAAIYITDVYFDVE